MDPTAQPPSFEEATRELSPILLRYLHRLVGERQTAEDLLQETLLRIARGLSGFNGQSTVKTWAFSIATHVAADYYRRPDRRARIVDMPDGLQLADGDPAVEDRMIGEEMNACVRQVIDTLPADYRAAIVLHDLEGLTAEQIGEVCGCSVATAKIRVHRARVRLRGALQEQCDFYRDRDNALRCDRKA